MPFCCWFCFNVCITFLINSTWGERFYIYAPHDDQQIFHMKLKSMCPHLFSIVLNSNICVDLEIFFVFNAKCAQSYIGLFKNFLWCDPIVGMRRKWSNAWYPLQIAEETKNAFYIDHCLPLRTSYNLSILKYIDISLPISMVELYFIFNFTAL